MFKRILEKKLKEMTTKFPIVAILGPRQSGKTTLAKMAFPKFLYFSLEDPDVREFATSDPRGFLQNMNNGEGVILDEIQKAPHLFSYLQTFIDEKRAKGKIILTGSQNFLLHERISQSLAGRVALFTLLPLSIEEIQEKNLPDRYEIVLFNGLYPRIYDHDIAPTDWYPNYIQTYIEKDIRELKNVSDLGQFQRFVKLCAGRCGSIINYSDLGNDAGISSNTAKAWLSLLESSYICFFLQPYFQNFNKRLVKSPKLYFYDTGLACSLLGIESEEQLSTHYLKGELFESFLISEFIKNRLNQGLSKPFYYWRDKEGHEIDCLFESEGKMLAIEIKSGRTIASDYFKNLHYWQKLTGKPAEESIVLYGGDEKQVRSNGSAMSWKTLSSLLK